MKKDILKLTYDPKLTLPRVHYEFCEDKLDHFKAEKKVGSQSKTIRRKTYVSQRNNGNIQYNLLTH